MDLEYTDMNDHEKTASAPERITAKPPIVWLAQSVCALVTLSCSYFSRLLSGSVASVVLGLGLFYLAVSIAVQRRQRWARWLVIFFFGLTATSAFFQGLAGLATHHADTTLLVSSAVTFLVCSMVAVQFLFAERVREFFGVRRSSESRGGRRKSVKSPPGAHPENPYRAPDE